jgi:microcystin-dependent protein
MVQLSPLHEILNDTPADATFVDENYDSIVHHVNDELINRDGSVGMSAQLHLVGDPVNDNDAARKRYVDNVIPVGTIMMWSATNPPSGGKWLLCDGSTKSRAAYPDLFDLIGITYNVGTVGATDFMMPNMRGRFPVGYVSTVAAFDLVGESGGTFTVPVPPHGHAMPHTHTMPHTHEHPHTHGIDHNHPAGTTGGAGDGEHEHTIETSVRQSAASGATGSFMRAASDGATTSLTTNPILDSGVAGGGHHHAIDLPGTTGLVSEAVSEATTGGSSATNTGGSTATDTADNTVLTGPTGGSIATTMIQPYLTLNFIIRGLP